MTRISVLLSDTLPDLISLYSVKTIIQTVCVCVYVCVYIYIYYYMYNILTISLFIYIYIYIYTHIHISLSRYKEIVKKYILHFIYIYIYIYILLQLLLFWLNTFLIEISTCVQTRFLNANFWIKLFLLRKLGYRIFPLLFHFTLCQTNLV